jgi:hypothetical protein
MSAPQRRRRGLSAQAADTAVDQACRQLRLPSVRGLFGDMVVTAEKEQLTCQGFWRSCCWPSATTGSVGAPSAG